MPRKLNRCMRIMLRLKGLRIKISLDSNYICRYDFFEKTVHLTLQFIHAYYNYFNLTLNKLYANIRTCIVNICI